LASHSRSRCLASAAVSVIFVCDVRRLTDVTADRHFLGAVGGRIAYASLTTWDYECKSMISLENATKKIEGPRKKSAACHRAYTWYLIASRISCLLATCGLTTRPNFTQISELWSRFGPFQCDTLCTSGFVDDVMFRRVREMAAPGAKSDVSVHLIHCQISRNNVRPAGSADIVKLQIDGPDNEGLECIFECS